MRKVLIALDYDSNSHQIAKIGHQMAKDGGAQTILLHIVENESNYATMQYDPLMGMSTSFDYTLFTDVIDTKGYIDAGQYYLDKIKNDFNDESIQTLVKIGDTATEILANANYLKADLIVMGTHSKKWLEKILVGSVAESVLAHSKIPLLLIPTKKYN